ARLKWRTRESLTCFAAAIRFLSFISRWIMDQIDLALLTLRFLARVQLLLRESAQLFRSAPHLLHDTSCLSCAGSRRCCGRSCRRSRQGRCRLTAAQAAAATLRASGLGNTVTAACQRDPRRDLATRNTIAEVLSAAGARGDGRRIG